MTKIPVIAILDVGKTNKKLMLFDEGYQIQHETNTAIPETTDEDGFPCEDIDAITQWANDSIEKAIDLDHYLIKAINVSAHGAGLVHLDDGGKIILPLYNYLKPYPDELLHTFYETYGGKVAFSQRTASPALGSLNAGLQLYRLKYEHPERFDEIKTSLHLPQYISYVLTHHTCSDITSIGCHTGLWNFEKRDYDHWVREEGIDDKLAQILPCNSAIPVDLSGHPLVVGTGLHDSSAALIPYLKQFENDFVLLSTGTWNITLNPFNSVPLTEKELDLDCLCYLNYEGHPVKASRLFAGHAHEQQTERIASYFHQQPEYHLTIPFDTILTFEIEKDIRDFDPSKLIHGGFFTADLSGFSSFDAAYRQLIVELVKFQKASTALVLGTSTKHLFVDGGFSKNRIFMKCLAAAFPTLKVSAATVAQASALGAAMVIHGQWSAGPMPGNIIKVSSER